MSTDPPREEPPPPRLVRPNIGQGGRDASLSDGRRALRSGSLLLAHQQRALALAELPLAASFYSLRHSHISRAIEGRMPLSLVAENLGTSLLMIQKNYAKVLARTRRLTIQQTSPRLRRVK